MVLILESFKYHSIILPFPWGLQILTNENPFNFRGYRLKNVMAVIWGIKVPEKQVDSVIRKW